MYPAIKEFQGRDMGKILNFSRAKHSHHAINLKYETETHLNCAIQETVVLSWPIQQPFGIALQLLLVVVIRVVLTGCHQM